MESKLLVDTIIRIFFRPAGTNLLGAETFRRLIGADNAYADADKNKDKYNDSGGVATIRTFIFIEVIFAVRLTPVVIGVVVYNVG